MYSRASEAAMLLLAGQAVWARSRVCCAFGRSPPTSRAPASNKRTRGSQSWVESGSRRPAAALNFPCCIKALALASIVSICACDGHLLPVSAALAAAPPPNRQTATRATVRADFALEGEAQAELDFTRRVGVL